MNDVWDKVGDFNPRQENFGSNVYVYRESIYNNKHPNNRITEFGLRRYDAGGSFQCSIQLSSRENYNKLLQTIVRSGLSALFHSSSRSSYSDTPLNGDSVNSMRFETSHILLIRKLLDLLVSGEPLFGTVRQDLLTALRIDPNEAYLSPTWVNEGHFSSIWNSQGDVSSKLDFHNINPNHSVKRLTLVGHRDRDHNIRRFCINVTPRSDEDFRRLCRTFSEAGYEDVAGYRDMIIRIPLQDYVQQTNHFINVMQSVLPEIEEIREEIIDTFQNAVTHTPRIPQSESAMRDDLQQAVNQSLASSSSSQSTPLSDVGANETKADELQKQHQAKFNEKLEIPAEYLCNLMNIVMTTPVIVPGTPDVRFERAVIEHWIKSNHNHPLTRAPLKIEDLTVDTELQKAIETFLKRTDAALNPPPVEDEPQKENEGIASSMIVHNFKRTREAEDKKSTEEAAQSTIAEPLTKRNTYS